MWRSTANAEPAISSEARVIVLNSSWYWGQLASSWTTTDVDQPQAMMIVRVRTGRAVRTAAITTTTSSR